MLGAGPLAVRPTVQLVTSPRQLWLPFLVVAGATALGLWLLWLAPHPPCSALLAPPLRNLFGDRVLHSPSHLWFFYHAMRHTHVAASVIGGAFMSALACALVGQAHAGRPRSLREALVSQPVRYGTILFLGLITQTEDLDPAGGPLM